MKLHVMTYVDSAGAVHKEWFVSKAAAVERRQALREQIKEAGVKKAFGYEHDIVEIAKGKDGLLAFLNGLTGAGAPIWSPAPVNAVAA